MKRLEATAFLFITLVLLSSQVFAAGKHCHYFEINTSPSMTITFTPEFKEITSNNNKRTFVVPEGAKLKLTNISTYIDQCVDGARSEVKMPLKVVKITGLGNEEEWMKGYEVTNAEACDGGNVLHGIKTDYLESLPFNQAGTYDFRIEYTRKINANPTNPDDWLKYADIQIIVVPGQISIKPAKSGTIGLLKSIWGDETEKEVNFFWEIKNESNVDIKIDSVEPAEGFCSTGGSQGYLKDCSFPDFKPGLELGKNASYILKMKATAKRPNVSPQQEQLSLKIIYSDIYGMKTADSRKKIEPINMDVEFTVNAIAITPFYKTGTFQVEPGKKYYAQFCNDSPETTTYGVPLHFFEIYDETGRLILSRSFHSVAVPNTNDACNKPETLKYYNNSHTGNMEEALLGEFTVPGEIDPEGKTFKNYTWKMEGIIGVNDTIAGNNYKSDFFRIGKTFDGETVQDRIVDTSFGPQRYEKSETPLQKATINIFEGTKDLGLFSPQLSSDNHSNVFFTIGKASFTNTLTRQKFTFNAYEQRIASEDTEIFVIQENPNSARVYGRTSARKVITDQPIIIDANLAWIDREKYMIEIKAISAGICRDLDGSIISTGNNAAFTGKDVKPKIKYEWRPANISESFCSPDNSGNYNVCDSTQFSIMLIKKLNIINDLISEGKISEANSKLSFPVYMMRDGFSQDFRNDFDVFMHERFFDSQAQTIKYYNTGNAKQISWDKYFKDQRRLTFSTPEPILQPGKYMATISFEWDDSKFQKLFDNEGNPKAKILVKFVKIPGEELPANLLYYLPIDAYVGKTGDMLHRDGYGVGFKLKNQNSQVPFFILNEKHDFDVYAIPTTNDSKPLATIEVERKNDFASLSKNEPGKILSISKKETNNQIPEYTLIFAASVPLPIIFKAENTNGNKNVMGYIIKDNKGSIDAGQSLARLVEIAYLKEGKTPMCNDPETGKPLPQVIGTDSQLSSYTGPKCDIAKELENTRVIYVFGRESNFKNAIALETVFYAPSKGDQIRIKNACQNQGVIYVPTLNDNGNISGARYLRGTDTEITLDNPSQALWTISDALNKIETEQTCIAYSTIKQGYSKAPLNVGIYWNEQEILSTFRDKINNLASEGFNANACFSN